MTSNPQHNRAREYWLKNAGLPLVYLVAVGGLLFWGSARWLGDDPYITYRYAANLAQGLGFVYNPGEAVLSTTSPLFTLLLAGLGWLVSLLGGDANLALPLLARALGSLSLPLGALCLYTLGRGWQSPWVSWVGLLLYPTFPLLVAHLGAETPLYLALCLAAFTAYARRRLAWAGAWAALATLARPDGLLVALVLFASVLLDQRPGAGAADPAREERFGSSQGWRALLLFALLLLPWLVFSTVYFGSPVPLTLAAKQAQGSLLVSRTFLIGFADLAAIYGTQPAFWLELPLALVGSVWMLTRRRRQPARPHLLLLWTLLYTLVFSSLGVSRYYWYYAPLAPYFLVGVAFGLAALAGEQRTGLGQLPQQVAARTSPAVLAAGLILVLLAGAQWVESSRILHEPWSRLQVYRQAGEWLQANTRPEARVGALEVGILGYYARRPLVDFAGLLEPGAIELFKSDMTLVDVARLSIERYQPDYVAAWEGDGYLPQGCLSVQRFAAPGGDFFAVYLCTY